MKILGISAFYHDASACLVEDGVIVSAAQEEWFTRKKHDDNFPENAINYCLNNSKINSEDLDYVAFYDNPYLKFERILCTYLAYAPAGINSFSKAMAIWLKKKIWIKKLIRNKINYSGNIVFHNHHKSHAASAFFPSPFNESAVLTMDGAGEWATISYGVARGNNIKILADIRFPHSIGLLYSAFTYYTGFKVNSGEYKVMGLSPYGEPKYKDLIYEHLIDVKEDGSFKMNMEYFNYCAGLTMTNSKFHDLFDGPPRKREENLAQKHMDLARSIQEVTEETVMKIANHVKNETQMKYLCLAGGVALNCVANGKLLRSGLFEDIWIQPAAGDAGGAVGCALFTWYQYLNNKRIADDKSDTMKGSYLGPEFDNSEIESFLNENSYSYQILSDTELPGMIADLIAKEKVIGWFQGRMEFGPRALGSRSIIGDARSTKMQRKMNMKIKYRESFRPFAPSVRSENVTDYFEIDRESPYMLLVANVQNDKRVEMSEVENSCFGLEKINVVRSEVPAITHVDYSARIQSVNYKTNPRFHQVLSVFYEKYGCPVVVNTSFNVRGEPVVCSPNDAYLCFMRTEMDYLIMGNYLLDKNEQSHLEEKIDWRKEITLD